MTVSSPLLPYQLYLYVMVFKWFLYGLQYTSLNYHHLPSGDMILLHIQYTNLTMLYFHFFLPGLFFFFFLILFIQLWLCWVFVSVLGLSLVAASGGQSSLRCAGLSLSRPLLLRSTGSRCAGSAIVAHGPSRSVACGIFPDQGSHPCPLHWQADSQPLRHQGSPSPGFFKCYIFKVSIYCIPTIHGYYFCFKQSVVF